MKLAALLVLGITSAAEAGATLSEDNRGTPIEPSRHLFEASCDVDVTLSGAIADVEMRQRIASSGPEEYAATYDFDLPPGAVITGFAAKLDGAAAETALPIAGTFASVDVAQRAVLGADPALLRKTDGGYQVRVQPLAPDHQVTLITRYAMTGELRGNGVHVVLRGRDGGGRMTACRGAVRASAGPGASIAGIRIDRALTSRATAPFVLDATDVAIDAEFAIAGKAPVVWTQSEALADGWMATTLTVAAPALKTSTPQARRALFVIDGSRSMELVGKPTVAKVVGTIAAALPQGVSIEGVIFDRGAKRVFDAWKPDAPGTIAALQAAITSHVAANGTGLTSALALAHAAIADGTRSETMVIVISDAVLGDVAGRDLTQALDMTTSTVDVLAVVLDPAQTQAPSAAVLRSPVELYGGAYVELAAGRVDDALQVVDEWLRPSWVELALGDVDVPATVHAGGGFTRTLIHKGPPPSSWALTGRGASAIKVPARVGPKAPVAALALAGIADARSFANSPDPSGDELDRAARTRAKASLAHPFVKDDVAFAVLTTQGKIARNRIAVVKGGGPYERITAIDDMTGPPPGPQLLKVATPPPPSAIDKLTLERLFRDQLQPKAFVCYQRALGTNPQLAGTILFEIHLGRGEITEVGLTGTTDTTFARCLEDAAYALNVPFPDFSVNSDDQTIAHYPLTFNLNEARPVIVLGDADSASPLDIDAIQGGVPVKVRGPITPNATTPLGNLRPTP